MDHFFKRSPDRLLPPKWDNLVVSLPVLAFSSKAMVVCSGEQCWAPCPIASPSRTSLGAMCQNLVVFELRVDPNPELRHPPSPANLGERKGKVFHHARFGRNACLPVLGRMPASREDLTVKVFAIYHQMDLGFIKTAIVTTRSKL